nr:MAG TPA: hyaluronidase [Caudoviricetes sp.]
MKSGPAVFAFIFCKERRVRKMSKKRMLALVLAAIMTVSSSVVAFAEDETTETTTPAVTNTTEGSTDTTETGGDTKTDPDNTNEGNEAGEGVEDTNGYKVEGDVAVVTKSEGLQKAIDANCSKIRLDVDVTDTIVIDGQTVELDLNGHTIQNAAEDKDHTITVKSGSLTINGEGIVDNVSHACAAIHNDAKGKVVLNGGTYTRSKENGQNAEASGGNSFYNIRNYGHMTINEGVTIEQDGHFSSMIENGYYDGKEKQDSDPMPEMIINGGTFSGGLNTIKNDDWGELTINGGNFINASQAVVLNWNETTITGGYFETEAEASSSVILNGSSGNMDQGKLEIKGGEFKPGNDEPVIAQMSLSDEKETATVSGGVFHSAVFGEGYEKVTIDQVAQVTVENSGAEVYRFGADARNFEAADGDTVTVTANPKNEEIVLTGGETVTVKNTTDKPVKVNGTTVSAKNTTGVEIKADGEEEEPVERDRSDDGDYYGVEKWDEVKSQIRAADEGDTIKVSGTGLPYFPSSVARELKGRDITLEIRKNGVTYKVNGLEIGEIDKIWYEFENIEEQLLTAEPEEDKADEQKPQDGNTVKENPATGR